MIAKWHQLCLFYLKDGFGKAQLWTQTNLIGKVNDAGRTSSKALQNWRLKAGSTGSVLKAGFEAFRQIWGGFSSCNEMSVHEAVHEQQTVVLYTSVTFRPLKFSERKN